MGCRRLRRPQAGGGRAAGKMRTWNPLWASLPCQVSAVHGLGRGGAVPRGSPTQWGERGRKGEGPLTAVPSCRTPSEWRATSARPPRQPTCPSAAVGCRRSLTPASGFRRACHAEARRGRYKRATHSSRAEAAGARGAPAAPAAPTAPARPDHLETEPRAGQHQVPRLWCRRVLRRAAKGQRRGSVRAWRARTRLRDRKGGALPFSRACLQTTLSEPGSG